MEKKSKRSKIISEIEIIDLDDDSTGNVQHPDFVHCYDGLTNYLCPLMLHTYRKDYKRRTFSKELQIFFRRKNKEHSGIQNFVYDMCPKYRKKEDTIAIKINNWISVDACGNIDVIEIDRHDYIDIFEVKSFFHLFRGKPYHKHIIQVLIYAYMASKKYKKAVRCHIVYLNKAFTFWYNPMLDTWVENLLFNAKRSIEAWFTPVRTPLKNACYYCELKAESCNGKRRYRREYWEQPGS